MIPAVTKTELMFGMNTRKKIPSSLNPSTRADFTNSFGNSFVFWRKRYIKNGRDNDVRITVKREFSICSF